MIGFDEKETPTVSVPVIKGEYAAIMCNSNPALRCDKMISVRPLWQPLALQPTVALYKTLNEFAGKSTSVVQMVCNFACFACEVLM